MKKRVVLVDDHVSIRQMLKFVLHLEPDIEVVGGAGDGLMALEECRKTQPDLVILDLILPELCGMEVMRRLRGEHPSLRFLLYSGATHLPMLAGALREQPHGFVQKSDSLETLREALRVVLQGGTFLTPFFTALLRKVRVDELRDLTAREREVVQMVAQGHTTKEAAALLGVTPKTVDNHRAHIMEKLGLHDAVSLARFAIRAGLLEA